MFYGLSKTKEMSEHNYQRESSGCNSKCSMRSCATERVINKAGISGSCSCSIGFTVRQQPKTFFFLFTTCCQSLLEKMCDQTAAQFIGLEAMIVSDLGDYTC